MQIIFFIIGVIGLFLNDYTETWSKIFPTIVSALLITTSLYSMIKYKHIEFIHLKKIQIYHIILLILTCLVITKLNIYAGTVFYVIFYKIIEPILTTDKQLIIVITLLLFQFLCKTFLYFNI
jgi:hypothetical protein